MKSIVFWAIVFNAVVVSIALIAFGCTQINIVGDNAKLKTMPLISIGKPDEKKKDQRTP